MCPCISLPVCHVHANFLPSSFSFPSPLGPIAQTLCHFLMYAAQDSSHRHNNINNRQQSSSLSSSSSSSLPLSPEASLCAILSPALHPHDNPMPPHLVRGGGLSEARGGHGTGHWIPGPSPAAASGVIVEGRGERGEGGGRREGRDYERYYSQ